jgi:tetratricopeptide (TPR) repeat protein
LNTEQEVNRSVGQCHERLIQAETLRLSGNFDSAEIICQDLLLAHPDYFAALHTIGLIFSDKGQHQKAVTSFINALMLKPKSWTSLTALAGEYLVLGAHELAIETLQRSLHIHNSDATTYSVLGLAYFANREFSNSFQAFTDALSLDPEFWDASLGFANVCMELGRIEQAAKVLISLYSRKPRNIDLVRTILDLPSVLIPKNILQEISSLEAPQSTDDLEQQQNEAELSVNRAAAFNKLGNYEKAWENLRKGNEWIYNQQKKKAENELRLVQHRLAWFRSVKDNLPSQPLIKSGYPNSVFLLGPSRSGKSTAEQLLSGQSGVAMGYENSALEKAIASAFQNAGLINAKSLMLLPTELFPSIRDEFKTNLEQIAGNGRVVTSTSPAHIWDAPILFQVIPNLIMVFVKRDIEDLFIKSYMRRYYSGNALSYDESSLWEYLNAYFEMMELIHDKFPNSTVILNYEDMVANPKRAVATMSELCNIPFRLEITPDSLPNDVGCSGPYVPYFCKNRPSRRV